MPSRRRPTRRGPIWTVRVQSPQAQGNRTRAAAAGHCRIGLWCPRPTRGGVAGGESIGYVMPRLGAPSRQGFVSVRENSTLPLSSMNSAVSVFSETTT